MLPLEGIKVIDLTTWAFAPACSAALGDWGAEVIKIEHPETGDLFRWFLTVAGIDDSQMPITQFGLNNRNKRGMAFDLKQPEGRDIVYKLAADADIFVSNLPAASLKGLELDYDHLSEINPRLIYAHASGYGEKGPDMNKPGYDATAFWARSGLMTAHALPDQPPVNQGVAGIGDQVSGLVLFGGVLLALYNRTNTGKGQKVDLSLLGMGTWVCSLGLQYVLSGGEKRERVPRHETTNPLVNLYRAKDGKWVYFLSLPDEPYWSPICNALGLEELEHDLRFSTRDQRLENNVALIALIDEAMLAKSVDEWTPIFDAHELIWTHIPSDFYEVVEDPQVLANDHIVEVDHPDFGPTKIISTPIRLNDQTPPIRTLAPEIGQHNEEILLGLDYSWDDIAKLQEKGVLP